MSYNYDVVIIGSGVGGLATAALLSKKGLKVLVCEKNSFIGGYASSIIIDKFVFDIGAQNVTFFGQRGMDIIRELEIDREYIKISPQHKVIFPDYEFYWSSKDETKDFFIREFPRERKGINLLFQLMEKMYSESDIFFKSINLSPTPEKYPHILKYSGFTATQLLNKFVRSEKLKSLLSCYCQFYQGLPPSRLSALHFAGLLMSYFRNGSFYYSGGCSAFTSKLRACIEKNGGLIKTNAEVKQILLTGNKVSGILTEEGEKFNATYIVSNVDCLYTFSKLIGYDKLSSVFLSKLNKMQISHSRFEMFLGVKMDNKEIPFVIFLKDDYDTDREFEMSINNQPVSLRCLVSTVVDPNLASEGHQCISIVVISSYDVWKHYIHLGIKKYEEEKEKLCERLLDMLKKIIPFFHTNQIVVKKIITPIDLEEMTYNRKGSLYGWELSPSYIGMKRIFPKTPIENLYMVGQWTVPGGSVCLIFRSADIVSSFILDDYRKSKK